MILDSNNDNDNGDTGKDQKDERRNKIIIMNNMIKKQLQ